MKLYEVKALAHETQSRIRQDVNAWNDFLEHASRVYVPFHGSDSHICTATWCCCMCYDEHMEL